MHTNFYSAVGTIHVSDKNVKKTPPCVFHLREFGGLDEINCVCEVGKTCNRRQRMSCTDQNKAELKTTIRIFFITQKLLKVANYAHWSTVRFEIFFHCHICCCCCCYSKVCRYIVHSLAIRTFVLIFSDSVFLKRMFVCRYLSVLNKRRVYTVQCTPLNDPNNKL